MQDLTGKKIGRYKILKSIGEGGMATVYLAEDTNLERQVAVKVIRAERVTPEQLPRIMERFKREAKALARLSDEPGIVTVYDYGEFEGTPYLVMAYMPGGTLKERLGQPMAYREAARLLLPVAEALSEAHEHGIIHRDVKPSNLLVTRKDTLALADFGIAKALENEGQTLTSTGMGVGTPEYMAPEQWKGEASPQTDIYSLGVVYYEMVTGKKPYTAGTPSEVFLKQMTQPPERPRTLVPGLPEAVEALLDKAMDKDPQRRFANMIDFQAALAGVLRGEPIHDETTATVKQPAVKQPDSEATYDELSTPVERVQPAVVQTLVRQDERPRAAQVTPVYEQKGGKRGWLYGGLGLVGILTVIGLVSLFKGSGEPTEVPAAEEPAMVEAAAMDKVPTEIPTDTPTAEPTPVYEITTMIAEKDGMEMVYVLAGAFTMGSNDGDSDEQPMHEVVLDAYWMDKYEVTNAQYSQCVTDGSCGKPSNTGYFADNNYADHPVVYVSWYDAKDYCEWAGRRLPTEAEWEKAARGTDERIYPWGNGNPTPALLNFDNNEGGTMPVGSYPDGASPFGALDMAGNVWEWAADWYSSEYYSASPDENPGGPISGDYWVLRGGSYRNNKGNVRVADRYRSNPSNTGLYIGFRCAVSE